jgi:hypothetical protein
LLDFVDRSEAHPAKDRNGRTPTLDGVLKQKPRHKCGQDQPIAIAKGPQRRANEGQCRGIHFNGAFDVPFTIEFAQPGIDFAGMPRIVFDAILNFLLNPSIEGG